MQTPLLGLAIVIIVAVVTALVGPLFIDWNRYRPQIEFEATRLVGAPVRVVGAIDVRLLPTPSITLGGVFVGQADREINARSLAIEFSLGALLRGQWRAVEMRLVGPQINVTLAQDGHVGLPALVTGFDLDSLTIDRLNVDDGSAILADAASGSRLVLEKLWFDGEVRSLLGSFRGEGAFVIGGELYGYRVSAARTDENGLKIKFGVDQSNRPLSAEVEGLVSLDKVLPRFEGTLALTRAAAAALSGGKAELNQPWRATSHVKATHASALFEQIEFQFGAEERAIKFGGTAQMKFGNRPQLDGVLYARQLNLDRLLADTDAQRRLPFAAIKTFAQNFAGAWRPPFPIAVGVGIDTLMLSGSPIQSVRGDIVADAGGWNLKTLEFRAPGLTDVMLSGRLDITAASLGFSGPIEATASDPKALIAWLEGHGEPQPGPARALRVKGEVTLGAERIAVERLFAEIDRKSFTGRLAYVWAIGDQPARLDAALNAGELDVDALLGFAKMALAGTKLDPPGEVSLAASIDRATIAGIDARQVRAMLRLDRNGLAIERLSLADFGGAALEANGHIDTRAPSPRGTLTLGLEARHFGGATALASTFLPQAADPLRRLADRIGAIKLRATLDLSAADENLAQTSAKLSVEGLAGAARIQLRADVSGEGFSLHGARIRADGKFEADDGAVLIKIMGLDTLVAGARGTSRMEISADGPLDGSIKLNGRLAAGEFQATAEGTTRLFAEDGVSGDLQISVIDADLRKLRPASASAGKLPLSLTAKLVLSGARLTLNDLSGKIAEGATRGRLGFDLATPTRIDGKIEMDSVDISAAIAAVAGMPASPPGESGAWPKAPFQPSLFPDLGGSIEISSARAVLTPNLVASNVHGRLRFAKSEIALEGIEGGIAGGRFKGTLVLRKEGEGLTARTAITLTGADAAMVIPGGRRPPITGRIGLQLELDGTGLSPRALIGSLGGTGSVSLEGAQFAGLDPKAFAAATKMADQGLAVDLAKARDIVAPALASGNLTVAHAETAVTVAAGEARLSTIVARGEGADITVNGGFDLTQGTIDARILLSGPKALSATLGRPEIAVALKGPYSAPIISHDVSALVSWLALHSVDQQSKKLRDIEAERRRPGRTDAPSTAPALPPPIEISPAPGRKTQSRSDNAPIQAGQPRAAAESSRPVDVAR